MDNIAENAQNKQKRKSIEALFDDRYIAENYYRGFQDGDGILHEKDGTISKLKQFDYKVHKLMKDPEAKVKLHDRKMAKRQRQMSDGGGSKDRGKDREENATDVEINV